MPSASGKDSKGCYWKWGGQGKKYYYSCGNKDASARAKAKADKQGAAAYASGYKGALKVQVPEVKIIVNET